MTAAIDPKTPCPPITRTVVICKFGARFHPTSDARASAICLNAGVGAIIAAMRYDLIVRNGTVVDGDGVMPGQWLTRG
ncbi:MAG: hypothetical protein ACREQB_13605 [Candidatus Binataceae bacterium]